MSLSPYTSELGVSRAKHLLRRACFHYNKTLLYQISSLNVNEALDLLFSDNTISYAHAIIKAYLSFYKGLGVLPILYSSNM